MLGQKLKKGHAHGTCEKPIAKYFVHALRARPPPITVPSGCNVVAQYEDERGDTMLTVGQQSRATASQQLRTDPFTLQRR